MASKKSSSTLGLIVTVILGVFIYALLKSYLVAATVNGKSVSRYAVVKELETQSGKKALDALITRTLIDQKANEKNIEVSQKEIDAEIKKIEANIKAQGGTLEQALEQQGMTRIDLTEQLTLQLKLEKLAGGKTVITDKEVDKYVTDNADLFPTGGAQPPKAQIKEQLQQEKSKESIQKYLEDLKKSAKIQYSSVYK
ncbi:MAG: SurA N-terminal domain-containing protein [Microgenomates group bacterium]